MRILSIVHQRDAGSGVFADAAKRHGAELVEWIPAEQRPPAVDGIAAALVFGGGMHVDQEDRHPWLRTEKELLTGLRERATPALGVCLGAQLLAEVAGGRAHPAAEPEFGWKAVERSAASAADPLIGPLPERFASLEWHRYEIDPPPRSTVLARSETCLQAYRLDAIPWWGIQFHAEATLRTVERWARDHDAAQSPCLETVERWAREHAAPEIDTRAIVGETRRRIAHWNELGRDLACRFLDLAAARARGLPP